MLLSFWLYFSLVCDIIITAVFCKAHYIRLPIIQKRGMNAFFFFFEIDLAYEIAELERQLESVSKRIPCKNKIKELVINAAKGKKANN